MSNSNSLLARFPWLVGSPRSNRTITWPADVADKVHGRDDARMRGVLDDRFVLATHAKDGDETWVFYADLRTQPGAESDIAMDRVALLPMQVDMIALLPRRDGDEQAEFVTLKANVGSFTLCTHMKNGKVSHERRIDVETVYGHLVVGPAADPRVAVCTYSGQPLSKDECGGWPWPSYRLDYRPGYPDPQGRSHSDMYGDTIMVWDWERDEVTSVDMSEEARPHNASFDFLLSDHFAIAAQSLSGSGTPAPELQVRRAGVKAAPVNAFVEVLPTSPEQIEMVVAQRGSSRPSGLMVHEHFNSGYLSILPHRLLVAENLETTADHPKGVVETHNHADQVRILEHVLPKHDAPVQVGNRVLVSADAEEEEEPEGDDDNDNEEGGEEPPAADDDAADVRPLYILDFESDHVNALLALSDTDRTVLSHALANAAEGTSFPIPKRHEPLVEVITRHYDFNIHDVEQDDLEYDHASKVPEEWQAHLAERERARKRARKRVRTSGLLGLEYDERPLEHRGAVHDVSSACVRIKIILPAIDEESERTLALTDSGILMIPVLAKEGHMFYI